MESSRLLSRSFNVSDRLFSLDILLMSNGCFLNISEGESPRIGAITLSVKSMTGRPTSSSLIPERRGSMLAEMVGELLAEKLNGIAVTSLYLKADISADIMKILISKVKELLEADRK